MRLHLATQITLTHNSFTNTQFPCAKTAASEPWFETITHDKIVLLLAIQWPLCLTNKKI